ncbi:(2Fe-2S)-binding protein [Bacillus sp. FJAT-49736]|uniref:(2Fe-2S)-binding protein n=1 Tax=Bacillus sp. FJAT-49736 TaxID=2833582 RepID=UPI001BCA5B54|nr:(2Fe-2S)-binding protein [Bacillus sp. FJAT-49736]MBS4173099.1 (2Fe-2S)-binding protein [Bacillus sp. FJAT-49736]
MTDSQYFNGYLQVNGEAREVHIRARDTLLTIIRDHLGLTGTKYGCGNGDCGACTIIVDGWPQKSCLILGIESIEKEIVTIEGLPYSPIQQAYVEKNAFQCGYCTPGFIMNAHALTTLFPEADEEMIQDWLESNICRCTSYQEMMEAIHSVLKRE